jgi:hypothetical protein
MLRCFGSVPSKPGRPEPKSQNTISAHFFRSNHSAVQGSSGEKFFKTVTLWTGNSLPIDCTAECGAAILYPACADLWF